MTHQSLVIFPKSSFGLIQSILSARGSNISIGSERRGVRWSLHQPNKHEEMLHPEKSQALVSAAHARRLLHGNLLRLHAKCLSELSLRARLASDVTTLPCPFRCLDTLPLR